MQRHTGQACLDMEAHSRAAQQHKQGKAPHGNSHTSHTQHTAATSLLEAEKAELMATRDKLATANEEPTAKLTAKQ